MGDNFFVIFWLLPSFIPYSSHSFIRHSSYKQTGFLQSWVLSAENYHKKNEMKYRKAQFLSRATIGTTIVTLCLRSTRAFIYDLELYL